MAISKNAPNFNSKLIHEVLNSVTLTSGYIILDNIKEV
jgi:hypothetical protein